MIKNRNSYFIILIKYATTFVFVCKFIKALPLCLLVDIRRLDWGTTDPISWSMKIFEQKLTVTARV